MTRLPLQMTKQCKQTVIVYNKNNHYIHCLDNKMHLCFQIDHFCGATEAVAVCLARASPVKTVTTKKNELINNAWRVNRDPPEACCLNVNTEFTLREAWCVQSPFKSTHFNHCNVLFDLPYCLEAVWESFGTDGCINTQDVSKINVETCCTSTKMFLSSFHSIKLSQCTRLSTLMLV